MRPCEQDGAAADAHSTPRLYSPLMWYEFLLVFGAGFAGGVLMMAIVVMGRDSDIAIGRILNLKRRKGDLP